MTNATWTLHLMLIRMAKGAIRAWENWLRIEAKPGADSIEVGAGPISKSDLERG